jgi:hypothetical protein
VLVSISGPLSDSTTRTDIMDCRYAGYRLGDEPTPTAHVPRYTSMDQDPPTFFKAHIALRRPCVFGQHPVGTSTTRCSTGASTSTGTATGSAVVPPSSKRARTEPAPASSSRWEWSDAMLSEVAGAAAVAVEVGRPECRQRFGHGERETLLFSDFLKRLGSGDESVYLTAQTTQQDEAERPLLSAPPAQQLLLGGHAPLHVPLLSTLVLAQIK